MSDPCRTVTGIWPCVILAIGTPATGPLTKLATSAKAVAASRAISKATPDLGRRVRRVRVVILTL